MARASQWWRDATGEPAASPVNIDRIGIRQNQQVVGVNGTGKRRRRQIFIDNRFDSPVTVRIGNHRDPASAAANHQMTGIHQRLNGRDINNI